jgi:ribose 5-phosphate isomerase B
MVTNIKIAIGCDHAGFELKEAIANHLSNNNVEYIDCGAYDQQSVDYPDFAKKVVSELNDKNFTMGILVCGKWTRYGNDCQSKQRYTCCTML